MGSWTEGRAHAVEERSRVIRRLAIVAAVLAVPILMFGLLIVTAFSGAQSGWVAASGPNQRICVPDVRLAAPGPSAGHTAGLSGQQVVKAAYAAGFRGDDLVIAAAVAKAESQWNPLAKNSNTNGSTDYGLFQINSVHEAILSRGDWRNPADNARMAYQVWSDAGQRWGPWVTFWKGTYKQYVQEALNAYKGTSDLVQQMPGCSGEVLSAVGLTDPGPGPQAANGYTPRAQNVRATTTARWGCRVRPRPCIKSIYGYAPRNIAGTNTPSDHATGNAADVMLGADYRSPASNALGWEIARFWQANAAMAGIKYVIFDAKIWSAERAAEGWRPYQHPGGFASDVFAHRDHVHVSVKS